MKFTKGSILKVHSYRGESRANERVQVVSVRSIDEKPITEKARKLNPRLERGSTLLVVKQLDGPRHVKSFYAEHLEAIEAGWTTRVYYGLRNLFGG